jgi:DNA-binding transcriptional regulator/RsmH inhibitor MraZ
LAGERTRSQLAGLTISDENIRTVSRGALSKAELLDHDSYKILLAQNLIKKMLLKISV